MVQLSEMAYICNYNTPGAAVGPPERDQPDLWTKRLLSHLSVKAQYDHVPLGAINSVAFSGKTTQFFICLFL